MPSEIKYRRMLAPGGGFVSPAEIFQARSRRPIVACNAQGPEASLAFSILEQSINQTTPGFLPVAFGSATFALYALFSALREKVPGKELIALSGYTCPSIAAAAVRAGFKILPLEISLKSLELESAAGLAESLDRIAAVVLSNLYGLVDAIDDWKSAAEDHGFLVVDDACQAAYSVLNGQHAGQRSGSVGVLSFGRGKAVSGISGGMLLVPESGISHQGWSSNLTAECCFEKRQQLLGQAKASGVDEVIDLAKATAVWALERPELYCLPASLPWLKLGETEYEPDFPVCGITSIAAYSALAQWEKSDLTAVVFHNNACHWQEILDGIIETPIACRGLIESSATSDYLAPIRFPLLFESQQIRDKLYQALASKGLGVSLSYLRSLQEFPELRPSLVRTEVTTAVEVARCLITLPVHRYVTRADISKSRDIIASVLKV